MTMSAKNAAKLMQNLVEDFRKGFDRNLGGNLNNSSLRVFPPPAWRSFSIGFMRNQLGQEDR
ncbi:hypothetical protein Pla8534_50400 [Lignipirellula cremea]|uniref:Uncharacterized protein n=1 Tax=Lignipirellula cremea TaxID=2528010 RepID=A0A518DZF4_9BACT|nr:hypothetical protein Pla8534_50400 [Lignipirellula cremea]